MRISDWSSDVCASDLGIGLLTGARLITSFQRGDFRNADAFIAFLGLDLRISQSGRKKGRSCLTKRGDPEVRRLLHNAAMSARRTERWKEIGRASCRERGCKYG